MSDRTLLPDVLDEILQRVERLPADARAQWGKMTLPQMLAHCQRPFEVATGELLLKRNVIGFLLGGFAKKRFIQSPRPFGRNSPTDPHFLAPGASDVERERARLLELTRGYGADGPRTTKPHPFFGAMTRADWDHLMWKHLDHHLRQFGA